jgi:hypothetical protein
MAWVTPRTPRPATTTLETTIARERRLRGWDADMPGNLTEAMVAGHAVDADLTDP